MANEVTLQRRQNLAVVANQLDEIARDGGLDIFQGGEGAGLARQLAVACAIQDMRALLTPEVMAPIMALCDTDLGFRTDKDPTKYGKDGKLNVPYSVDDVRDVVIESRLRGFNLVGNEFNIIAHRFYAAKAGFRRKLTDGKSFPGLSNFRDTYEVPRMVGDKGALIKCRATWNFKGKPDSLECEFAVRVNAGMGADAVQGKAERKLCKRVHDLLAGVSTPEGEAGEEFVDVPAEKVPSDPAQAPRSRFNPVPQPQAPPQAPPSAPQAPQAPPEPEDNVPMGGPSLESPVDLPPRAAAPAPQASGGPLWSDDHQRLADYLEVNSIAFGDFRDWMRGTGRAQQSQTDSWGELAQVPANAVNALLADKTGLSRLKTIYGGSKK